MELELAFGIWATLPRGGQNLPLERWNLGGGSALELNSDLVWCSDRALGMIKTRERFKRPELEPWLLDGMNLD